MYCKNCGSEMPDDALFCSHCGTKLEKEAPAVTKEAAPAQVPETAAPEPVRTAPAAEAPKAPAAAKISVADVVKKPAEEPPRKPFLEEMQWNVSEYPDSNVIEKTEDIDFDWNTDPSTVPDATPRMAQPKKRPTPAEEPARPKASGRSAEGIRVSEIFDRVVPAQEVKASIPGPGHVEPAAPAAPVAPVAPAPEDEKTEGLDIGKFHTFNRKSAEFRELLDKEYEKILDSGTIGSEQSQADAIAREKFDSRQEEMTMEQFLEKEGTVKLYEPKPLESDVLARIEAQERKRARQKAEEEARVKAQEEARLAEEARKKAELARLNNEAEASAAAAEEIRLAEEAEIRRRTEAEARRQAERQAAHLEAIASRQAAQEQAALEEEERRIAEEARKKAEAEERARAEAAARAKAEAEAARIAEEEARRKAEEELNAAREAARARALEEARLAAQEEARFRQEQERRRREEEALKARQQERQKQTTAVEAQVKDALAQTARMREEEEAKIKAALAGIRGGRFSDTLTGGASAAEEAPSEAAQPVEIPQATEVPAAPAAEETPAAAETAAVATAPDEIEEAHRATRHQFDEMARAREDFFAGFPDAEDHQAEDRLSAADLSQTRVVSKDELMTDIDATKKLSRQALNLDAEPEATAFPEPGAFSEPAAAPEAESSDFSHHMDEMDALLNQFARVSGQSEPAAEAEPAVVSQEPAAADLDQAFAPQEPAAADREPVFTHEEPAAQEPVQPADIPMETAPAFGQEFTEQPAAPTFGEEFSFAGDLPQETTGQTPAGFDVPTEPAAEPALDDAFLEPVSHDLSELFPEEVQPREPSAQKAVDDLFAAIEEAPAAPEAAPAADAAAFASSAAGRPAFAERVAEAAVSEKPGLEDTMVMPMAKEEIRSAASAVTDPETAGLSKKELKKLEKARAKEARRAAKKAIVEDTIGAEDAVYEEEPRKGGVGRTILMIILILLCVVFALELAGIGIKLLAPTSGAAEFIDNILNNLIHMITGSTGGGGLA